MERLPEGSHQGCSITLLSETHETIKPQGWGPSQAPTDTNRSRGKINPPMNINIPCLWWAVNKSHPSSDFCPWAEHLGGLNTKWQRNAGIFHPLAAALHTGLCPLFTHPSKGRMTEIHHPQLWRPPWAAEPPQSPQEKLSWLSLTHSTLLLTEGLGPKLLLPSSGDSVLLLLPRGDLAGSSKSSRFPMAAVGRAQGQWGDRERHQPNLAAGISSLQEWSQGAAANPCKNLSTEVSFWFFEMFWVCFLFLNFF